MPQIRYDIKIDHPFNLTDPDKQLISDNKPTVSKDWDKSIFSELKFRIRHGMSVKQDDFCPYCGTKIEHDGYGEPLEHIIDKSRHPEWMFEPKNLVLSCYACNTKKSTKDVMISECHTGDDYPTDSLCVKIIHPHFDTYLDHIEIINEIFIKARNNDKGWCTIDTFGLLRLQLPMRKAHALSVGNNVIAIATEALSNPNLPPYLIQQFEELILNLVTRYKEMIEDQNEEE